MSTETSVPQVQEFHLGEILSVTTSAVWFPNGGWKLLDFMTQDTLSVNQLERAAFECRPHLLNQHPDLAEAIVPEDFSRETYPYHIAQVIGRFGEYRSVAAIPAIFHPRIASFNEPSIDYAKNASRRIKIPRSHP